MRRGRVVAGLVLSMAVACQSGSNQEVFCEAVCDRVNDCDRAAPDCVASCVGDSAGLSIYTRETVSDVADCIGEIECSDLFDDNSLAPCWEQASGEVRATTRAFCASYMKSWFECGYWVDVAECEREFAMLTDSFLDLLASCQSLPCSDFETCVDQTWESTT